MTVDFDAIIVGSGPAGVSVAFPLVEAGMRVLMVDGGRLPGVLPTASDYLSARAEDTAQWKWMVGDDFHALKNSNAVSPKLRVPAHAHVFAGFAEGNNIGIGEFVAVGSMARGGLSNAWGCGVARLSHQEMKEFPFLSAELDVSYAAVSRRIGLSGAANDDLAEYFGVDDWADAPILMDALQSRILTAYSKRKSKVSPLGLRLGHSRVAALSQDRGDRKACNLSGNCLWGCRRRALYSATEDLELLEQYPNFTYFGGLVVDRIVGVLKCRRIEGRVESEPKAFTAKKVVLAAGTLATTRLALQGIGYCQPVKMQSCPTAAFLLCLPSALGAERGPAFGFGQLSFALALQEDISGFGSLFSTTGIPLAEFAAYVPFRRRFGVDILRALLSSCVVGNMFLPGYLSTATLCLGGDGTLRVEGGYSNEVSQHMALAEYRLRKAFWRLGAVMLPKSFNIGRPGSDIHYAGSLPMRTNPVPGETDSFGGLCGLEGVHIADGASLSTLSEKSHTLTLMASADRIGRKLAQDLRGLAD